ncbi:hypothetical protein IH992_24710 [Candidatus Poribacteria bacterium]|nr:hypothetical protein [Candidatus Poribacteria bacterium]
MRCGGEHPCSFSPAISPAVFLPQLRRFANIECRTIKRGYYPKGNGKVEINIKPKYNIYDYDSFNDFINNLNENIKKFDINIP